MKNLLIIFISILIICYSCSSNSNNINNDDAIPNAGIVAGENLFKANCSNCHKPQQAYIGPALQGVAQRWPSKELLYEFVKNSADVISRNDYAKKLFNQFNQSPMLAFPNLSNTDIDNILAYCNKEIQP